MVINLEKRAIQLWIKTVVFAIITGIIVIVLLMTNLIKTEFLGLSRYYWSGITVVVYLVYYFYNHAMDYNYLYYSDEENEFILRFYKLLKMNSHKYAIEIPRQELHHYEIRDTALKNKEYLILYRNTRKGVAKYPPASISLLNAREKQALKDSLNKALEEQKG